MVSVCGFVISASFNFFVRFFDENIKKSQKVGQFYFLDKLNLNVQTVKIVKKYVSRGVISKSNNTNHQHSNKGIFVDGPGAYF